MRSGALAPVALLGLLALASCGRSAVSSPTSTSLDRASRPTPVTEAPTTTSTMAEAGDPGATGLGSSGPAPTLPPPAPGWSAALTTLPPGGGFSGLSCLSDTFCIAVGGGSSGEGTAATDGSGVTVSWDGAAWSGPSVYLPAPITGPITAPILPAVSCTSGPTCVIVDGSVHASVGDGTHWSTAAALAVPPCRLLTHSTRGADIPGRGRLRSRVPCRSCAWRWTTPGRRSP